MHVKLLPVFCAVLMLWLPLFVNLAHAQTLVSRSLADEMDSTNTATARMLELVKAAKAQEQAAKGFGPASPLTAINPLTAPAPVNANSVGNTKNKASGNTAPPETPILWYLAGIGERLVAELIYQQRVYKLSAAGVTQSVGPWRLLSLNHQGLSLSHQNGQVLELRAPEPGQSPPQLAGAPAVTGTPAVQAVVPMAVPAIVPSSAPGTSSFPNMFPLPK
jgi:hypothetical protein